MATEGGERKLGDAITTFPAVAAAIHALHTPSKSDVTQDRLSVALKVARDTPSDSRDVQVAKLGTAVVQCQFSPDTDFDDVRELVGGAAEACVALLRKGGESVAADTASVLNYRNTLFQELLPSKATGNDDSQAVADALWRKELNLGVSVDVFDDALSMWRHSRVIGVNDQWLRVSFEGTTGVAVWVSRDSPRIAPKDSMVTPIVDVTDEAERWRAALTAECEVDFLSLVDNKWWCGRVTVRRAGVHDRVDDVRVTWRSGGSPVPSQAWVPINSSSLALAGTRGMPRSDFGVGVDESADIRGIDDGSDPEGAVAVYRGQQFGNALAVHAVAQFFSAGGFDAIQQRLECHDDEARPGIGEILHLVRAAAHALPLLSRHRVAPIVAALKDAVFRAILSLPDQHVRHFTKDTIAGIGSHMRTILRRVDSPCTVTATMEEFSLQLVLKLAACPFLQLRLLAVKILDGALGTVSQRATVDDLRPVELASWVAENHVLEEMFNVQYGHPELMKRSVTTLKFLIARKLLTVEHVDAVWAPILENPENTVVISKVLEDVVNVMPERLLVHLLDNIAAVPVNRVPEELVRLVKRLSSLQLYNEVNRKCLEVLWGWTMDGESSLPQHVANLARQRLLELAKSYPLRDDREALLLRCIPNLESGKCVPESLEVMWAIINVLPTTAAQPALSKASIVSFLDSTAQFLQLLVDDFARYKVAARAAVEAHSTDGVPPTESEINALVVAGYLEHEKQIQARLDFLERVLGVSSLQLLPAQIDTLWHELYDNALTRRERDALLQWVTNAVKGRKKGTCFDLGAARDMFLSKICNPHADWSTASSALLRCFKAYFVYIGEYDGWVELIGESDFALRQPPANIPVLDVLWDFILNATDKNVVTAASEFLIAVHQKISFIMGDQKSTVTRGFVESCMGKLEGASSDAHGDVVSLRCLQLLEKLVNEHDKAGSAGLRAHSQRLRGELLTLDVANNLVARPVGTPAKFQIKLFQNATLWELRHQISLQTQVPEHKERLFVGTDELLTVRNPRTLAELGMYSGVRVAVCAKHQTHARTVDLLMASTAPEDPPRLTPRATSALSDIYRRFANTQGRLSMDDCASYFLSCGAAPKSIRAERMEKIFSEHETDAQGLMTLNGFLHFYAEAARLRAPSVWKDLRSHGFNDSLALVAPHSDTDEAAKQAAHPRSILTSNPRYFDVFFKALASSETVATTAWSLLMRLPTNPVVLENLRSLSPVRSDAPDWNPLLDSTSPFRLLYSLQIMEMILEPPTNTSTTDEVDEAAGAAEAKSGGEDATPTGTNNTAVEDTKHDEASSGDAAAEGGGGSGGGGGGGGGGGEGGDGEGGDAVVPEPSPAPPPLPPPVPAPPAEDEADVAMREWIKDFVLCGGFQHLCTTLLHWRSHSEAKLLAQLRSESLALLLKFVRLFLLAGLSHSSEAVETLVRQQSLPRDATVATTAAPAAGAGSSASGNPAGAGAGAGAGGAGAGAGATPAAGSGSASDSKAESAAESSKDAEEQSSDDRGTSADLRTVIEHMPTSVASVVQAQVDVVELARQLLRIVHDVVSGKVDDGEATCVEHALRLWVALCANKPAVLQASFDSSAAGGESCPTLDELTRSCMFCASKAVRREFASAVRQLCAHVDTTPPPQEHFLRLMLAFLTAGSEDAAAASLTLPEQCEEYFQLLNALLTDRGARAGARGVDLEMLTTKLLRIVKAQPITERRGTRHRDRTLAGVLNTVTTLMTVEPSFRLVAAAPGLDMVRELYDSLFTLPTTATELDESESPSPPKCKTAPTRAAAYKLLATLCDGNAANLQQVVGLMEPLQRRSTKVTTWKYRISRVSKAATGYVGIRNLGCICYMNSMLQQFFMMPHVRAAVLSVEDAADDHADSVLYQLQTMFGFLSLSERQEFVPNAWCQVFKDNAGRPVNVKIQQDAEEFLGTFLESLSNKLKGTPRASLVDNMFTYSVTGQLVCSSCKTVREREETGHHIAVEVKNFSSLQESLANFVAWETIPDYQCESCQQRANLLRRQVLKKVPRVLFIHLKRMVFNFDTMVEEKLHSRFEFGSALNIAAFANSEISEETLGGGGGGGAPAESKASNGGDGSDDATAEPTTPAAVSPEFYEYTLSGIVCHTGETARAGHYYSFIRDRSTGAWNEFNDSVVKPFNYDAELEERCFGGKAQAGSGAWSNAATNMKNERIASAYILVYERKMWDAPAAPPQGAAAQPDATAEADLSAGGGGGGGGAGAGAGAGTGSGAGAGAGAASVGVGSGSGSASGVGAGGGDAAEGGANGDNDDIAQLRQLVENHEGASREALPSEADVPPLIAQQVFEDNLQFFQDQQVYTSEHFDFFAHLMRVSVDLVEPCMEYETTARTRAGSVESIVDPDHDSPMQFGARVIELGTKFLLDTLSHAADMAVPFKDIGASLVALYKKHIPSCKLFLSRLTRHATYIDDLLLCCNSDAVRTTLADLIGTAAAALLPFEEALLLEQPEAGGGAGVVAGGDGGGGGGGATVIGRFVAMFTSRMPEARKNWPRFNEYFSVFDTLADASFPCRRFMIERGLITRLLDFFLGDKSPVRPADAPVEGALGNTVMQPKYFHLLNAAMKLIQCATTRPTGDVEHAESPSPTTAPRESPLVPVGATLVPLLESDGVLLHSQVLYTHAMQDGLYADQVCEIMAHMMWENKDFTALSISWILAGLQRGSYDSARYYWKCIRAVLAVQDSLHRRRVAMVLGDPFVGTVAAGAGLGLPPLAPTEAGGDVSPDDEQARRAELAGVKRGVLNLMRDKRDTDKRMVYACVKQLLALANDAPEVAAYINNLPPVDPRNEDMYTDWMFDFLHEHVSTSSVSKHTYMPTPGQLARQQSSEETFESLQAFQRKHTTLVTATPDPRYVRNDVKLLVALERGSVVKRTHNMNVVVCKMLQFIHPDTQRSAVGFVVSSKLKDPIVFKLNLEYPKSGNPVNFPYPDKDNLPIVAHIPSNSKRLLYWAHKIDDAMPGWGAYVFNWSYVTATDLPEPFAPAATDPALDEDPASPPNANVTTATPGGGPAETEGNPPRGATRPRSDSDPARRRPGTPAPGATNTAVDDSGVKEWECGACTFLNPYTKMACDMCDTPRPA